MKAKFLALAALVLGLASCQQEPELFNPVGGEVDVVLTVDAEQLATRAAENDGISGLNSAHGAVDYFQATDWTAVDLRYTLEVYDVKNEVVGDRVKARMTQVYDDYQPASFDLRLVPGREYRFVVFADFVANNSAADYNGVGLHHDITSLADIKVINDGINNEATDAYFDFEDVTVNDSTPLNMVLTRPYGKIRVVATDLAELNLNIDVKAVEVTYTATHPTTFNAVTGEIGAYTENVSQVFTSEISERSLYNAGYDANPAYMTLFTDYILARAEGQDNVQFTLNVYDDEAMADVNLIKSTPFNTTIPVERNHLTTVIGNVLTTATEINVTIDDKFADEFVNDIIFVDSQKTLQEALNVVVDGQIILFVNDIQGDVTAEQIEGRDIIIDGNGYTYNNGTIYIDGNSRSDGAETITIKNLNFETSDAERVFVEQNSTDGAVRYPHNVTIEDCTFEGDGADVIVAKFRQGKNIVIKNCNAEVGHSLMQLYGCTNVTVDNVEVEAGRGISFGTSTNITVKDSYFEAESYGLRADATVETALNIENVTIEANLPVIARKASKNYTINFAGNNTLEAPGYQVVFTTGDDEATFLAPAQYTINGDDNFIVFPRDDRFFAYSAADLQHLLNNTVAGDNVIEFAADIVGDVTVDQKEGHNVVIDGRDYYMYDGTISIDGNSRYTDETVTIKNINFETADAERVFVEQNSTDGAVRYPHNVTIEDCTFEGDGADVIVAKFRQGKNIVIKNCNAEVGHSLMQLYGCTNVTVEGVEVEAGRGISFGTSTNITVKNSYFGAESYGLRADATVDTALNIENVAIEANLPVIARNASKKYAINFAGNNTLDAPGYQVVFTTGDDEAAFVAPAEYILTGADDFVVFPREKIVTAATATEVSDAIANGATHIVLAEGTYVIPAAAKGKTVTFIGSGDPEDTQVAVTKVGTGGENCDYGLDGSNATFENLTITTNSSIYIGYARCNGTYRNCIINGTYTLYGNSVFEDCTFNVSGDVYNIWTWGAPTATFTRCTFNCDGKAMLLYGMANTKLTMNNCVFNDNGGLTDLKAAIEIGNDYNTSYELVVNQATVNGFEINDKGINTGTTLWANKNSMGQDKLNVVVDGVDVY